MLLQTSCEIKLHLNYNSVNLVRKHHFIFFLVFLIFLTLKKILKRDNKNKCLKKEMNENKKTMKKKLLKMIEVKKRNMYIFFKFH